jgi:hypothetical protein
VLPNVVRARNEYTEVQSDDVRGDACFTHGSEVHAMCSSSNAQTVTDGGHSNGVGSSHSMHCHSSVIDDVMLPKFTHKVQKCLTSTSFTAACGQRDHVDAFFYTKHPHCP